MPLKSINRLIIGLLAFGAISCGLKLYAQQAAGLTPPPRPEAAKPVPTSAPIANGPTFIVGERLLYNVSWSNFPSAARLTLEVADSGKFYGQDGYQIRTKVETVGRVRSLFGEIDNQYITYINLNTAVPYRLVNSIRQGQKQVEETVVLDQFRQQAIFSDERTISTKSGTFDFPSLVYAIRSRPWPENGKQKFTAIYGSELIEIEASVKNQQRITTGLGIFDTVCLSFSGQKKHGRYRGFACFSNDGQKLPVLMTAKLPFGEVRAELASITITARPSSTLVDLRTSTDESGNLSTASRNAGRNAPAAGPSPQMSEIKTSTEDAGGLSTNGHNATDEPLYPFGVGERLNYDISWGNFLSVGKASFEVRQQGMLGNNRVFVLAGEATTSGAVRALIDVNDQMNSYALIDRLTPIRTDLRLHEGKRIKQLSISYNLNNNSALLSTGSEVAISPKTFDMVSLFYAIRACELKIGSSYSFPFLDANARPQSLVVSVIKQESIGGPMGTRNALQLNIVSPATSKAIIAQVWISDDSRRLPLYLATRTKFGELRFQMTSATNTK